MSDSISPNYGLVLPEDGGSFNTWGPKLNKDFYDAANSSNIDTLLAMPRPLRKVLTTPTAVMNLALANYFKVTIDQNTTLSFSNVPADVSSPFTAIYAAMVFLEVVNGSAHTITYPGSITWLSGQAPALQASGTDLLAFWTYDNGTSWAGAKLMSSIGTEDIEDAAVTTAKIADLAVTTGKLDTSSVTTTKIADGAVTNAKLATAIPIIQQAILDLGSDVNYTSSVTSEKTIAWDTEVADLQGWHAGGSTDIVIPSGPSGQKVQFTAKIFASPASGITLNRVKISVYEGSTLIASNEAFNNVAAEGLEFSVTTPWIPVAGGGTFQVRVQAPHISGFVASYKLLAISTNLYVTLITF
jgi:hypothetical protein